MAAVRLVLGFIPLYTLSSLEIKSSVRRNNIELKAGLERSKKPLLGQHSDSKEGNRVFLILPDTVEKASEGI